MFEELRLFAEKLGFSTSVLRFFAHEGPISAEKKSIYTVFAKNPNRIFNDLPRTDVWSLGIDSKHSALLRHFFWGGSARGMRERERGRERERER